MLIRKVWSIQYRLTRILRGGKHGCRHKNHPDTFMTYCDTDLLTLLIYYLS